MKIPIMPRRAPLPCDCPKQPQIGKDKDDKYVYLCFTCEMAAKACSSIYGALRYWNFLRSDEAVLKTDKDIILGQKK